MALLEIKKYPEDVLKQKAEFVEDIDGNLQSLIDSMIETMYAAPGIGLAAPQVGVSKRVIVIDTEAGENRKSGSMVLINPEIIREEGSVDSEEGCLSIPGYIMTVKRAEKVYVSAVNREGRPVNIEAGDLLAKALQHEIDHINGKLIIDRISMIKREFFKKKYMKSLRQE